MARPIKQGLSYFPLDVALDTKFQLIEAEFGLKGFALVVKLLQKIYGEQGYYCEWTDEVELLFASKSGVGGDFVSELIKGCIKRGFFDEGMLNKYGILTSKGIQKRYVEAKRGDISKIEKEYFLLKSPITEVNATKTGVFATETAVNVAKSTQSKVNKSKVDKSRDIYTQPPTIDEVREYAKMVGSGVDAEYFFNYYQSVNWKCGNSLITDWKAKLRSWEAKNKKQTPIKPTKFVNYNQPTYSKDEIDEIVRRKKRMNQDHDVE